MTGSRRISSVSCSRRVTRVRIAGLSTPSSRGRQVASSSICGAASAGARRVGAAAPSVGQRQQGRDRGGEAVAGWAQAALEEHMLAAKVVHSRGAQNEGDSSSRQRAPSRNAQNAWAEFEWQRARCASIPSRALAAVHAGGPPCRRRDALLVRRAAPVAAKLRMG